MQMNNNVPDCWDIKKLDAIAKIQRGRFSIRPRNDPAYYGGATPFVQTGDISQSEIFLKKYSQTLNDKGVAVSKIFPKNTILITIAANIGDTAITTFPVACPDSLIGINNKSCDVFWLNYFLQTQKNKLNGLATQNAQKNINLETLNNLKIAVPPLAEQKKIAEILGTWDLAIEELTELIAEKKELKRGLMQQLLTGEIRISGFAKPWEKVKLCEIGTTYTGLSGKDKDDFGKGSYFIPYMNVYQNSKIDSKQLELVDVSDNENQNVVQYGDIFFTTSSETPEEVGFASVLLFRPEEKIYLNSFCFGYRLNNFDALLPNYAAFLFRSKQMRKIMYKLAQGATRFNLSKNELMKEKVYIPADILEQQAIADILSTIDLEIDLLNQQLDVLKEQKCGLMQKLLTGEIRVKVDTETC